jgi:hypothetical protein
MTVNYDFKTFIVQATGGINKDPPVWLHAARPVPKQVF